MIELQTTDIVYIYIGDTAYDEVYVGDNKVFPSSGPTPPTPTDYSKEYLTTVALGDGSIKFSGSSGKQVQYSTDNGATWSTAAQSQTVNVSTGERVLWKGTNSPRVGRFTASTQYEVEGNPASLISGDSFTAVTTLPDSACTYLFMSDHMLVSAENLFLSFDTLGKYCYRQMFDYCTGLTTAPILSSMTLADNCYQDMFRYCYSLTTAPQLPATTLALSCYYGMFGFCSGLTEAPLLPAETLVLWCYLDMFQNCSSLSAITCLATDISAVNSTSNWVNGVAQSGVFTKASSMSSWTVGTSGIPTNWVVQDYDSHDYSQDYLTTVAESNGTISFSGSAFNKLAQYSTDGGQNWSTASQTPSVSVSQGDKVLWKGNNGTFPGRFSSTALYSVEGNPASLISGDSFTSVTLSDNAFATMFQDSTGLTDATNVYLGWDTLPKGCCRSMFSGCTSLTAAPQLPATGVGEKCYQDMFYGCTSLTTAPSELPATTLGRYCYDLMFGDCSGLTTVPSILPATTLADYCYESMFFRCSSLTTAPQLPATTLVNSCYYRMFYNCSSLSAITCLATDISASYCTMDWTDGVASSGVFTKASSMSSWTIGKRGVPSSWTVVDAS